MADTAEVAVTSVSPERERQSLGTFAALEDRNFRLLLTGTTMANAAHWVQQVTLGWLVYDLTGSGTMLGTLNLFRSLATVGLAPVSGIVIDRFARRTLMLLINAWLLCVSLTLGIVLVSGSREVWYLFVFTFMGGVGQALDMPLRQTIVFTLVPRHLAANAVALVQTGWSLMRSVGPAIAGFMILWLGPGGNFLVQAGLLGLIMLNTLRIQFPPHQHSAVRRSFVLNLKDGLRYIAGERTTRTFLLMGFIPPLFIIPIFAAMTPVFAKSVFHGGPEILGLLISATGVGGILGGLFAASLGRVDRRGLVQIGALAGQSLALIAFALSPNPFAGMGCIAIAGFFEVVFITGNQTLLQLSIPDELRGRVTSITTLTSGLMPIGSMVAGAGSDVIGARMITVIMCSCAGVIAVAILALSPVVRGYRISRAVALRV
jgi:MFS transporter, DHA1 family, staphyloferrin A biosynthesis exporter